MRDVSSLFFRRTHGADVSVEDEQLMTGLTACFSYLVGVSSLEVDSVVEYPRRHLSLLQLLVRSTT